MPISLSGSLNLSGSLTTTGTITATTLVVQTITSSISSITGSTNFGSLSSNTHTFTGSINTSGSGNFLGSLTVSGFGTSNFSSAGTGYNKVVIRNTTAGVANGAQLSIGTDADPDQLYIQSFATTFTTSGMNVAGGAVINGEGPGGLNLAATQANIGFYTNGAGSANLRMFISSSGNVAIGTSTATNTYSGLTISGNNPSISMNTPVNGWIWTQYNNSSGVNNFSMGVNQAVPYWGVKVGAGMDSPTLVVTSGGNVGIGTTTAAEKLTVTGGISFSSYLLVGAAGYMGVANQIQGGWTSTDLLILNNNNGGKIAFNTTNGSAYNGVYLVSGATSFSPITSDIRTKKNFETTQGLAEVLQIEPTKYHLVTDNNSSVKRLGFKAQNLQPLIPEMVIATGNKADDGSDYLTIVPDYILPVLVKAIQELTARVQYLENK